MHIQNNSYYQALFDTNRKNKLEMWMPTGFNYTIVETDTMVRVAKHSIVTK